MQRPLARLRLGAFVVLALFVGIQIASDAVAGGPPTGPGVPTRTGVAVVGNAESESFRIMGYGGAVDGGLIERVMYCFPCSVEVSIRTSNLAVLGDGAAGILPPFKVYALSAYYGEIVTMTTADDAFVVTLAGAAEHIRVIG